MLGCSKSNLFYFLIYFIFTALLIQPLRTWRKFRATPPPLPSSQLENIAVLKPPSGWLNTDSFPVVPAERDNAEELIIWGSSRPFLQPGVLVLISHLAPALPPARFSHQGCVLTDLENGLDYPRQAALLPLITGAGGSAPVCSAPESALALPCLSQSRCDLKFLFSLVNDSLLGISSRI